MTTCAKGNDSMDMRKKKKARTAAVGWSVPWRGGGLCLALTMGLGACDGLLDVEIPGDVPAEALDGPRKRPRAERGGRLQLRAHQLRGGDRRADRRIHRRRRVDRRDTRRITASDNDLGQGGCTNFGFGVYTPLQTSRVHREQLHARPGVPRRRRNRQAPQSGALAAYAGYSYTVLGEGFCEPFDEGPLTTPAEAMSRAENWFGQAMQMAQQAGADDLLNMARVGQARVGQIEAAGIAAMVPDVKVERSAAERRWNRTPGIPTVTSTTRWTRSSAICGGTPDPRVVTDAGRLGHDGITPIVLPMKYTDVSDPIALATWTEASSSSPRQAADRMRSAIINALHARAGLPSFASSDPTEIRNQIIEERSREFFLEGRRQADLLRHQPQATLRGYDVLPAPRRGTHQQPEHR